MTVAIQQDGLPPLPEPEDNKYAISDAGTKEYLRELTSQLTTYFGIQKTDADALNAGGTDSGYTYLTGGEVTSSVASIEIAIASGYDDYILDLFGFQAVFAASNPARLQIELSDDDGATYKGTNGHYSSEVALLAASTAAISTTIANANTGIIQLGAIPTEQNDVHCMGYTRLVMPRLSDASDRVYIYAQSFANIYSADRYSNRATFGYGYYNADLGVNKIRLSCPTNIVMGRYVLRAR